MEANDIIARAHGKNMTTPIFHDRGRRHRAANSFSMKERTLSQAEKIWLLFIHVLTHNPAQ